VLESAVIDTQKAHSVLLKKLERQVASRTLAADKAVAALTSVARTLATGAVLSYARQRRELRRPPGKSDSLGDALSWEALLRGVPDGVDLSIVSSDPDFRSPLAADRLHEY